MAVAAPLSLSSRAVATPFVEFDERMLACEPALTIVQAPKSVHVALVAHAARRLRTSGLLPIVATAKPGAALFGEIARILGLGAAPTDPAACAAVIAKAALARHAAILAPLPGEFTWDRSVAQELARGGQLVLFFVTTEAVRFADVSSFEVAASLTPGDRLRWLSAVAEEAQTELPLAELDALESWWRGARRVELSDAPKLEGLDHGAREALSALALAGRSLSVATLSGMLDRNVSSDLDALVHAGALASTEPLIEPTPSLDLAPFEAEASSLTRRAVAAWLERESTPSHPDPWACARAAELLINVGDLAEADRLAGEAMRLSAHSLVSSEFESRWFRAVMPITGAEGALLRVQAAARALRLGEAVSAKRWCEAAAKLSPNDARTLLLQGRALIKLGDLVAARVCLSKAASLTPESDTELQASIATEQAEVSYLAGELDGASAHAEQAYAQSHVVSTRLTARATLGKVLLARGQWDLANEHFVEDALLASAEGETSAELRARLNRAIALCSMGRLEESRCLLEGVLEDGARLDDTHAQAYALSNLGLVAYRQHDYGAALAYWERTIRFPQAIRGRISTALTIANLADLRLRLGLVEHAEHAIAFGRQLLADFAPPRCAALYKWVAAQIALERNNTELARREIEGALVDAQAAKDQNCLESAWLVLVRVALEDGDLVSAAQALAQAESLVKSPRAHAELAIVRAMHLRALGKPALDSATEALQLARASGEDDLLTEVHSLVAHLHRDAGDEVSAQAHCARALSVREQVASGLSAELRAAYVASREAKSLSRLQASLAPAAPTDDEPPRTQRALVSEAPPSGRELVGDAPAIRSLALAIKKVANSGSTVLIRGESGTGKELVAEALHHASNRASGPLVSVNCAALVETLLLSELFGHEKGAFTGASARRRGRFELAEGGTLFLDEIGDISPRTQVALLRVLQEKTFERVGGTAPIHANVRVVCATHRDLRAMVERGEFREDLYYRLSGITLEVPALRARLGDLPKIAEYLLRRIADERSLPAKTLSADALDLLSRHRWPGNIRELENVLRAVSLFADGDIIGVCDLVENIDELRVIAQAGPTSHGPVSVRPSMPSPPIVRESTRSVDEDDEGEGELPEGEATATTVAYAQVRQGTVSLSDIKRQIERDCIARALAETKGNITKAAALLGMKRPRLSQLVKQYGFSVASSEGST